MLNRENYKIYSFDVFDTLLTRRTARPEGIFCLLQEKLEKSALQLPADLLHNFVLIRSRVEQFVRRDFVLTGRRQDIRLQDIYERLAIDYHLSKSDVEMIEKFEMETEFENWILIEQNVSFLKEQKKAGKKIILVSDMYIAEQTLKKFLSALDPVFADIPVYVSGDRKVSKHFGDLFDLVAETEGIADRSQWLHIGDNKHADLEMPRCKGLQSYHFNYPDLAPWEKYILDHPWDLTAQLLIGQSKLMRLAPQHENFALASSLVAPVLYQYVDFVLRQSRQRGITDLYFLARDGFILRLIADEIIKAFGLKINTHYFYASRASIRIPNEQTIRDFLDTSLFETKRYISEKRKNFKKCFAGFANIPLEMIEKHFDSNKQLEQNLYKEAFVKDALAYFKHKRDMLIRYFEQEVSACACPAFVDLEGSGRSVNLLAALLNKQFPCFYYVLIPPTKCRDNFEAILFSYNKEKVPQLLELFCRYWEGQCSGYRQEAGRIVPVLEDNLKAEFEKWGWAPYVQGIQTYAQQLSRQLAASSRTLQTSLSFGEAYLDWLANAIDRDTAKILGAIPWSNLGSEKNAQAAPAPSLLEILGRYYLGLGAKEYEMFRFLSEKRIAKRTEILANILCPIKIRRTKNRKWIYFWGIGLGSIPRRKRRL